MADESGLTRSERLFYKAAISALAVAFAGLLVVFWYAANPQDTLTVKEPLQITPDHAHAGSAIRVRYEYCKPRPGIAVVGGFLASRGVVVPIQHLWASALPQGCHTVSIDLQVPVITPPGNYRLYLTREYHPTLFTQSYYLFTSEPFNVLAPEGVVAVPLPPMSKEPPPEPSTDRPSLLERLSSFLSRKK